MENTYETVPSNSTVLPVTDTGNVFDEAEARPPVLTAVFRSIFVEVPKDFFGSIGNFFKRYGVHYKTVFTFFHRPSLAIPPFSKADFRESAQLSFEIALLLVAAMLFLIKQNLVPVDASLQEVYGNDVLQMMMEFFIFVLLALAFFGQLLFSVLLGRLQRMLFGVEVKRKENDILYSFLNNSFFSLSAFLGFFFRLSMQYEQIKETNTEYGLYMTCFFFSFLLVGWWSVRFARLHNLSGARKFGFHLFSLTVLAALYGTGMSMICAFISGT